MKYFCKNKQKLLKVAASHEGEWTLRGKEGNFILAEYPFLLLNFCTSLIYCLIR